MDYNSRDRAIVNTLKINNGSLSVSLLLSAEKKENHEIWRNCAEGKEGNGTE